MRAYARCIAIYDARAERSYAGIARYSSLGLFGERLRYRMNLSNLPGIRIDRLCLRDCVEISWEYL